MSDNRKRAYLMIRDAVAFQEGDFEACVKECTTALDEAEARGREQALADVVAWMQSELREELRILDERGQRLDPYTLAKRSRMRAVILHLEKGALGTKPAAREETQALEVTEAICLDKIKADVRRAAIEECARRIETDENQNLDDFYCCSAMDGSTQTCACEAVSIREQLAFCLRTLLDQPAADASHVSIPSTGPAKWLAAMESDIREFRLRQQIPNLDCPRGLAKRAYKKIVELAAARAAQ